MTTATDLDVEVRELAAKTAAEIRRRGWTKNVLAARSVVVFLNDEVSELRPVPLSDCKVCLVGGVNAAANGDPLAYTPEDDRFTNLTAAERELYARIADRVYPGNEDDIGWSEQPDLIAIEWNDHPGTSVNDVLALLDSVALADTATEAA